ncbi:MAG: UDP-N-acetylmuramoyl-tripeptide--D-alanyl-D-alanine ligase [Planctomycetota bacterium]
MSFWSFQNLVDLTGGTWLIEPADLGDAVAGLWHDTREIKAGQAYLAIKGDNFDGHAFVDQAFDAGATLAIVSDPNLKPQASGPVLCVNDTITALQDLARAYRDVLKQGGCKVIGIAGSNGKTTTRHLIHHVLTHSGLQGTQSPKSFNNHLGVPLTLLSGKPQDDFVACEIGTNHPGEIDFLSAIARPDIAVITSIGEEHLAFFKTIRGVAKEEAAIIPHTQADGLLICPEDDWSRYLKRYATTGDLRIAHGWYEPEDENATDRLMTWPGFLNRNARLACFTAIECGVTHSAIDASVSTMRTPEGRAQHIDIGCITLIHDAYNANPSSTRESFDLFEVTPDARKVMIFGDMLELGDHEVEAHQSVGIQADTNELAYLITIGQLAKHAALSAEQTKTHSFERWSDDLPDRVADLLQPGDTVLLKASRGMRLERLIPAIERRFGKAE